MRRLRTRGWMILAVGVTLLLGGGRAAARSPTPYEEDPPSVSTPPPEVTGCTQNCSCTNSCGCTGPNCGETPPGGGTSNMPEPASLLSGLLGAGLASLYGYRRRKALRV